MLAAVFAPPPIVNDDWALNVVLMDDTEAAFKVCFHEQILLPFQGEMKIIHERILFSNGFYFRLFRLLFLVF